MPDTQTLMTELLVGYQIDLIHRGGASTRFHTIDTLKTDTIASHSFGVAMLAYVLTKGAASAGLLVACLRHDLGEYQVGDVPSPVKRKLACREEFEKLEESVVSPWIPMPEISAEELRILKLADNLDGLRFCIAEMNRGNKTIKWVADNYRKYLLAMNLTEYEMAVLTEVENLILEKKA